MVEEGGAKPKGIFVTVFIAILAFVVILPMVLVGFGAAFNILKLMNQPILQSSIPVWVVVMVIVLFFIFVSKPREKSRIYG